MTRERPRITQGELLRLEKLYGPVAARLHKRAAELDVSPMSEDQYHEWADTDHRAELACGGMNICPGCGCRSLKKRAVPTRNYGGGWDTYEECMIPCGYQEVFV